MVFNSEILGLILSGVVFVWLVAISFLFYRLFHHYQRLTKGITKKDLKAILEKILKESEKESKRVDDLASETKKTKKDGLFSIQKVGLVRFNPFAETGGDQSFCLAMLDGNGSGLVISSLHGREGTRIYAKPVRENKSSGYEFSAEEKRAIKEAKRVK